MLKQIILQILLDPEFIIGVATALCVWLVKNKHATEKDIAIAKRIYMGGDPATSVTDRTRLLIGEALDLKKKFDNQPEKNFINKVIGLVQVLLRGWIKIK